MADTEKIDAIRTYLQATFPHHELTDKPRGANGHDFKLTRDGAPYTVNVKRSFLDDHSAEKIDALLQQWRLERELRKSETAGVIIGNGGITQAWPDAPPS